MKKALLVALALTCLPDAATALELKNVRVTCRHFGALRTETKFLPGDLLFLQFDIDGIKIDADTGVARYLVGMEVFDSGKTSVFKQKESPNQVIAALGGETLPGYASFLLVADQKPGKYSMKIQVTDRLSKEMATHNHEFEVLPAAFGLVQPVVPAVGFTSQELAMHFGVIGMARDKNKYPNVEVTTRIIDEKTGKPTLTKSFNVFHIPKDLPGDVNVKGQDLIFVPVPVFFNRAGRFIIEVEAVDQFDKKTAKMKIPVTVLDPTSGGK
jgi:hypothetical protein